MGDKCAPIVPYGFWRFGKASQRRQYLSRNELWGCTSQAERRRWGTMLQAKETTCAKAGNKASEIKFRMSGGVDSEDGGGDSKLQRTERLNLQTLNIPGRVSSTSRTRGATKGLETPKFWQNKWLEQRHSNAYCFSIYWVFKSNPSP